VYTDYNETAYVSGVVVHKDHRDQKYATTMMDNIKEIYKKTHKFLVLGVNSVSPAVKLYKKAGFKEIQKTMYARL